MKKILLTLVAFGMCSAANAIASTGSIALSGSLAASCSTTIGTANIAFTLVPDTQSAAATSSYTLQCSAGTSISSITAASDHAWTMVEPVSNDAVGYFLTAAGFSTSYPDALISAWSNIQSSVTVSAAPFTITPTADPVIALLTVTPQTTPVAANVGTYSDNITITANY